LRFSVALWSDCLAGPLLPRRIAPNDCQYAAQTTRLANTATTLS
jgi:hypothetical protein